MASSTKIIEDLLKKVKANYEQTRQQEVTNRLNIYRDNWSSILKSEIDAQFVKETRGNIKQMLDSSCNVLKRIINEISLVYSEDAKRAYMVGDEENEDYKNIMAKIPHDLIMQEVNRLTNLCNQCLVYIVPRNGKIEYDIITPELVEVVQSREDPTKPSAIVYALTYVDTRGSTEIYYIYYDTEGRHIKFDKDLMPVKIAGNENGVNPYKDPANVGRTILPFVIFNKNYPINSVWDCTSGSDLVSATKQTGVLLTYLNYLFKVCSFKMLYFIGIDIKDIPKDLIFDPLYPKVISEVGGSIGTVDMQINLKELWEIVCNKIGMIANNYGLSLDNFKLTLSAQSGFALKIKNQGLEKIVTEQVKHYRYYEKELNEKTIIINNTMYKTKIPLTGVFKIDFAETTYPEDPAQVREQWKFDIQMGARTIYDYLMFINPDIKNLEQAEATLKSNVDINKQIEADLGIDIQGLLQGALKAEPNTGEALLK